MQKYNQAIVRVKITYNQDIKIKVPASTNWELEAVHRAENIAWVQCPGDTCLVEGEIIDDFET